MGTPVIPGEDLLHIGDANSLDVTIMPSHGAVVPSSDATLPSAATLLHPDVILLADKSSCI